MAIREIKISEPTHDEVRELVSKLDSVPAQRINGNALGVIEMTRDKAHRDVVRYNGEVDGKRFAFYCPRGILKKSKGEGAKRLTVYVVEH